MDFESPSPDETKPEQTSESSLTGRPRVRLLDETQWGYVKRRYRMSPRELEVARLVCQGFTNGDMAERLNVKPGTIKTHLRSLFAKVQARNKISLLLAFVHVAGELSRESPGADTTVRPGPEETTEVSPPVDKTARRKK